MNIIEAIHARHSVRTFSGEPLQASVKKALEEAINNSRSPFEGSVTMRLASVGIGEEFRPSTYGVIRNALDFLLLGFANDKWSAVSGGFRMEQVVLEATRLGLGTCWVGGTFKKGSFAKAADLQLQAPAVRRAVLRQQFQYPAPRRRSIRRPAGLDAARSVGHQLTALARTCARKSGGLLLQARQFQPYRHGHRPVPLRHRLPRREYDRHVCRKQSA